MQVDRVYWFSLPPLVFFIDTLRIDRHIMPGLFSRETIIADENFNRWKVPPASVAIHLCIGSVYAWSLFNPPLMRLHGVVLPASDDWTLKQVASIFTVAIVFLGLAAAVAGKWLERVGPRVVGTVAAFCWGGGFLIGALGIRTNQLWLLYLGYGVLGGCGLGLGYVSPVSTLIKWFPDRRGMAAGMAIMGFGGGAIIGSPLKKYLLGYFYRAPQRLANDVDLVSQDSQKFVELAGKLQEVVVVGANEATNTIHQGVYVVGTGNTGAEATFLVLGLVYFVVMLIASFSYRLPKPGWLPAGWTPLTEDDAESKMITTHNVGVDSAMATPQFYLLWVVLCFNVTAGIGVLSVAETMMREIFGTTLPGTVDEQFAVIYVSMIGVFNMLGRFFWASASDYIGRKTTYTIYFVLGMLLYLSIPYTASQVSATANAVWLVCFYAVTMIIFTMYGGGFATIPAYLSDLFGSKFVGGIHGRLLTAWSTAGVLGPLAITSLRENALNRAIRKLAANVDPNTFREKFGEPIAQLDDLIEKNTVTVAKLMEIAPAGTIDPSATLYNSTMYLMAALLGVALVCNLLVKPVDEKFHLREEE
jgi:MFS family permease